MDSVLKPQFYPQYSQQGFDTNSKMPAILILIKRLIFPFSNHILRILIPDYDNF